ncbi:hypothetical protein DAI22_12g005300 [Oryza sativa Japonica Group]|nr:hypothetical protein DAI22_12g005300 [Oryza sativa Japonica Group]
MAAVKRPGTRRRRRPRRGWSHRFPAPRRARRSGAELAGVERDGTELGQPPLASHFRRHPSAAVAVAVAVAVAARRLNPSESSAADRGAVPGSRQISSPARQGPRT